MKSPVSVTLEELLQLSSQAKGLTFATQRSASLYAGQQQSKMLGRGMEFAESRLYQQGDDLRTIDWRVTARTGKPHTKLFTAEKEREVIACVDFRSPMFFATRGNYKSVQASLLAGYLSWSGVYEGNRVGGILFDEKKTVQLKPERGKRGAMRLLRALSEEGSSYERREPQVGKMSEALEHLQRICRPGSLVFLISDFRNTPARFEEALCRISKHCDLFLCFVYDPFEANLPKDRALNIAGVQDEKEIATSIKGVEKYYEQFLKRKQKVEALLRYPKIHGIELKTDEECFSMLSKTFRKR